MKKIALAGVICAVLAGCALEPSPEKVSDAKVVVAEQISETVSEVKETIAPENSDSALKKLVEQEQKNMTQKNADILLEISEIPDAPEKILAQVILKNPDEQEIQSIQAWFTYPVSILKGEKITLLQKDIFPLVAPNEQNFDAKNGIVKLGFSAEGKGQTGKKTGTEMVLVEVEFSKRSDSPFQLELFTGHVQVMTLTKNGMRNLLEER